MTDWDPFIRPYDMFGLGYESASLFGGRAASSHGALRHGRGAVQKSVAYTTVWVSRQDGGATLESAKADFVMRQPSVSTGGGIGQIRPIGPIGHLGADEDVGAPRQMG